MCVCDEPASDTILLENYTKWKWYLRMDILNYMCLKHF